MVGRAGWNQVAQYHEYGETDQQYYVGWLEAVVM